MTAPTTPVSFDPVPYVRAPIVSLASGISLAHALVDACPKAMPASVKKSRDKLKKVADTAQAVLANRRSELGALAGEDPRLVDQEADTSFSAFRGALLAYAMLPAARYPKAARAAEIDRKLFGTEGLAFLKTDYTIQNATMAAVLQQIHDQKLGGEIDGIIGPDYLEQLRDVLPRYAAMVTAKLTREEAQEHNLSEHTRAIQAAIVAHATRVIASIEDDDPDTVAHARTALRPIDAFREAMARKAQGSGEIEAAPRPAPEVKAEGG